MGTRGFLSRVRLDASVSVAAEARNGEAAREKRFTRGSLRLDNNRKPRIRLGFFELTANGPEGSLLKSAL